MFYNGFPPQLFDLQEDPGEVVDLGRSDGHEIVRQEMHRRFLERLTDRLNRVTVGDQWVRGACDR